MTPDGTQPAPQARPPVAPQAPPKAPGGQLPPTPGAAPAAPAGPARKTTTSPEVQRAIKGVSATSTALIAEVEKAIIGKRNVLEHVLLSILADGHILFEDFPGTAKSLMVMTFASALGCKYRRIQFTPDLLPTDITGTYIFDEKERVQVQTRSDIREYHSG